MALAVKFYGANDLGLPERWPETVVELKEGEAPAEGFVRMSKEEYAKHRDDLRSELEIKQAPVILQGEKDQRVVELRTELAAFIEEGYPAAQQVLLGVLLTEAVALGFAERQHYILSGLDWVKAALRVFYKARDTVLGCSSVDEVRKISLDLSSLTDPHVLVEIAVGMNS